MSKKEEKVEKIQGLTNLLSGCSGQVKNLLGKKNIFLFAQKNV